MKLLIVDLNNFIFRAYFARKSLNSPDGTPVNALSGTCSMILKMIEEEKPTHILVAKDMNSPSFRKQEFPDYKANRKEADNDLKVQFTLIYEFFELIGIKQIGIDGYEADDIIASACKKYEQQCDQILIASSDKDLMQLVNDKVSLLDPKRGILNEEGVQQKMGVPPKQIIDYLSILGDSSDNIKGVKGIGAKGAASLLSEYEDLDAIYRNLDKIKPSLAKKLLDSHDHAYEAKYLISLIYNIQLPELNGLTYMNVDKEKSINFLKNLGFKGLIYKLNKLFI